MAVQTFDGVQEAAAESPAPRRRAAARTVPRVLAPVVLFALLGIGWQWVAAEQPSVLPPLGGVLGDLTAQPGFYLSNLRETLTSALIGGAAGIGVALLLAVIVVHAPWLGSAVMPAAVLIHATPILAIAPALIVAFGFGRTPHVIVVALITFFPMLINAITGLRAVDPQALEVFRSMAASRRDVFFRLRVPSSLGYLFSSGKTCVTLAVIGAIVSEFTGTDKGIGAVIVQSTTYLNLVQMWGAILVAALCSLILLGLVGLAERLVVRW
ncbi:ABC transporter permease [Actinomadura viridis]|uniref:ABC transporter permease n=1 Tax=Actinomadura viridis TaxID=58110 RepID=UPI0036929F97